MGTGLKILAVESSAVSASAAIMQDGKLLAEDFVNNKLTHSQTLMPMIEHVAETAKIPLGDIDVFAVAVGPGSFTGIRIGVASVKGIAFAYNKPCAAVSTLETIAQNAAFSDAVICAVMDARCGQVYNALFRAKDGKLSRMTEDRAIAIADLEKELLALNEKIILIGDGAQLCFDNMQKNDMLRIAPLHLRFQRGYGVAAAAMRIVEENGCVSSEKLMPAYLRMPQAERELKKKQGETEK